MSEASTYPACCGASPGLPNSWAMAIGNVVEPDLERNEVAPNSPKETAAVRPEARKSAGRNKGSSTRNHVCSGVAPNVADASRND